MFVGFKTLEYFLQDIIRNVYLTYIRPQGSIQSESIRSQTPCGLEITSFSRAGDHMPYKGFKLQWKSQYLFPLVRMT